jgi:hypothetical protein
MDTQIQPDCELCDICRCCNLLELLKSEQRILLGPVESIFSRGECWICRLITNIFLYRWVEGGYSKEMITSNKTTYATVGQCYLAGHKDLNTRYLELIVPTARFPAGSGPPNVLLGRIYLVSGNGLDLRLERSKVARLFKTYNRL